MYQYDIWYMSLYVGDSLVCKFERNVQTCIPDGHLHVIGDNVTYMFIVLKFISIYHIVNNLNIKIKNT